MKKVFKILGITGLIIIALLVAIPFAFQSQINDMVKRFINQSLNAKVEFSDVSLSFLQSFPRAQVNVDDLEVTNFEPFKDETFATAKSISFTMPIRELFKNADDDPIVVSSIYVDQALLTLKTDKFGNNNYDITKADDAENTDEQSNGFSFSLEDYNINNSAITYIDEKSETSIYISELNHSGHGVFSVENSELNTKSDANVSFIIGGTSYLSNNQIKLDAVIGLDLNNGKYSFKENKGFINKLPLEFDGFVQQLDNGQGIDITFKNPGSSFKDFLAIIPEQYSKNIDDVETSGSFKFRGRIHGENTERAIPKFSINIASDDASFKYPDLPKRVENIFISSTIQNNTGNLDDTYINISALNFTIDRDVFESQLKLKNITKNMLVNANVNGVLNLSNITKVYPIELENALSGILKGKVNTAFDMNAIETNAYSRIKNSGSLSINGFVFSSEDIVNPIHISEASMSFDTDAVSLNKFKAKTGDSDLSATGTIKNLLGFLLSDNTLQGNFNVNSNLFKVSDFMTEDDETTENNKTTEESGSLKIPAFLDCTINADAKIVVYDNLNLKDVKGILLIKDQQATIKNMASSLFDGELSITGDISTKNETPTFNLNLGADGFDIAKSFSNMDLLQNLAPVAKLFQGKLNSTMNLSGDLDKEFSPNLSTVSGNALAELLTTKINDNKGELFNQLEGALGFIDFDKLDLKDLKDLKTHLKFADGKVSVKPFDLKYEDISITVSGSHSFDKTLSYNAIFNVPAKYLGSDVNRLIGKIDSEEAKNISIPVTANIGGSYTSPTVTTDLTSGISNLTKQLIEIEKQKLLNQGKDKVKDLIGDVIGGNKSKTDSIKQKQNNTVKNVLNGIIGSNKTDVDTLSNSNNTVKDVLGGLLGKKKKKKDSVDN